MSWTILCDGVDGPQEVHTLDEVDSALNRAIQYSRDEYGLPTLVELSYAHHSTMAIVVGGARSVAVYIVAPQGPGFRARQHDTPPQNAKDPFIYMQFGSQSEADLRDTITPAEAWDALRLYFITKQRPETLDWG